MLSNHTQDIRECYQQAAHCLQQAEAQNDPKVQKQFLELTRRWLLIGVWSNRFHRDTINHDTNIATITVAKAAGGWPPSYLVARHSIGHVCFLAQSGHATRGQRCTLSGVKRTSRKP